MSGGRDLLRCVISKLRVFTSGARDLSANSPARQARRTLCPTEPVAGRSLGPLVKSRSFGKTQSRSELEGSDAIDLLRHLEAPRFYQRSERSLCKQPCPASPENPSPTEPVAGRSLRALVKNVRVREDAESQ